MSTPGPPLVQHARTFRRFTVMSFRELRGMIKEAEGFNAKFAVLITSAVGTMACAYAFACLSLVSLPATLIHAGVISSSVVPHFLASEGLIGIVSWIAQTFLQLVLLSIILVGQRVQSMASEARDTKGYENIEYVKDQVNEHTDGGLKTVIEEVQRVGRAVEKLTPR